MIEQIYVAVGVIALIYYLFKRKRAEPPSVELQPVSLVSSSSAAVTGSQGRNPALIRVAPGISVILFLTVHHLFREFATLFQGF